jgi:FtsH-binding integral membrane protein
VLGYIPWLLAYGATVVLGFRAAIFKERRTLTHMRVAMVALVVFGWISVFINFQFFSEDGAANFLGAYTAVVSSLWCAYWFLSRRVEHVMTLGNSEWNYEEFKNE